jgi:hypothetical protein
MKLYYLHRHAFPLEKLLALARNKYDCSIDAVNNRSRVQTWSPIRRCLQQAQAQSSSPSHDRRGRALLGGGGSRRRNPHGRGDRSGDGAWNGGWGDGTVPGSQGYLDPYAERKCCPTPQARRPEQGERPERWEGRSWRPFWWGRVVARTRVAVWWGRRWRVPGRPFRWGLDGGGYGAAPGSRTHCRPM